MAGKRQGFYKPELLWYLMDGIKSYTSSHRKKYINLSVIRVTLGICRTTTNKTLQSPLLCPIPWRNNYLLATVQESWEAGNCLSIINSNGNTLLGIIISASHANLNFHFTVWAAGHQSQQIHGNAQGREEGEEKKAQPSAHQPPSLSPH